MVCGINTRMLNIGRDNGKFYPLLAPFPTLEVWRWGRLKVKVYLATPFFTQKWSKMINIGNVSFSIP